MGGFFMGICDPRSSVRMFAKGIEYGLGVLSIEYKVLSMKTEYVANSL